jgi:GntR family transcriptional repressor for pyruvate dehydrogenase complex
MYKTGGIKIFTSLSKKDSSTQAIFNQIKDLLMEGKLKPGDRLPSEFELSEEFGVSRLTVREAMKMLSALGVVYVKRGDGTYISDQISSTMLEPMVFALILGQGNPASLIESRLYIEQTIMEVVVKHCTPEDIKNIESKIEEMSSSINSGNGESKKLLQCDLDFHQAILDATHNPILITIGMTLMKLFINSMERTLTVCGAVRAMEVHRAILQAIKEQDVEAAKLGVQKSLEAWQNFI